MRTIQRANRIRNRVMFKIRVMVRVRVLSAFTCLAIVRSANPQSAFYPWPVVERYLNCSYGYTLSNTTYQQHQMTEIRRYEILSTYEHLTHLKHIFYIYTKRCLATASNNSATTPLLFACEQ